jgi:hypothetical protein
MRWWEGGWEGAREIEKSRNRDSMDGPADAYMAERVRMEIMGSLGNCRLVGESHKPCGANWFGFDKLRNQTTQGAVQGQGKGEPEQRPAGVSERAIYKD